MSTFDDKHLGLTLTRCDCCGKRQYCAIEGVAMCESCCPGAVQAARDDAKAARKAAQVAQEAARQARMGVEILPGESTEPPVPYSQVAHLFK